MKAKKLVRCMNTRKYFEYRLDKILYIAEKNIKLIVANIEVKIAGKQE